MNKSKLNELGDYIETQEKKHYQSLLSLFKFLIGVLGIVFTAGAGILGYNVYQIKQNVAKELEASKQHIESLKDEAREYLAISKQQADLQIQLIEKEAKINALSAVKIKLEQELQKPQIQDFIYLELRKNIRQNLDILAEESFNSASNKLYDLTEETAKLNTAYFLAYFNDISEVKYLDSLNYNSNDKKIRDISSYLMKSLKKNYIHFYGFRNAERYSAQIRNIYKNTQDFSDEQLKYFLIEKIFKETDTENVTKQFMALIDITGYKIEVLEFQKLRKILIKEGLLKG